MNWQAIITDAAAAGDDATFIATENARANIDTYKKFSLKWETIADAPSPLGETVANEFANWLGTTYGTSTQIGLFVVGLELSSITVRKMIEAARVATIINSPKKQAMMAYSLTSVTSPMAKYGVTALSDAVLAEARRQAALQALVDQWQLLLNDGANPILSELSEAGTVPTLDELIQAAKTRAGI